MARQIAVVADSGPWGACSAVAPSPCSTEPLAPSGTASIAMRRFRFDAPSLVWRVDHGMDSDIVMHVVRDTSGRLLYAPVVVLDRHRVEVRLTSASTGAVDLLFGGLPV